MKRRSRKAKDLGPKAPADCPNNPDLLWVDAYAQQTLARDLAKKKGVTARPDFCGWSALGPISIFIEDIIGIKEANAFLNELTCEFAPVIKGRVGVANYRFGKVLVRGKRRAGLQSRFGRQMSCPSEV